MKNNRSYPLKLSTYEKSEQGVHPSLLYQPDKDPPFLLAFTPYPFSIDIFENPSILASYNGIQFFEETPNLNPIVPPPQTDHNDDPELFFYGNCFNILYLETLRPEKQNIVLLKSKDRKSWVSELIHTDFLKNDTPDPFIVSPSFVHYDEKDLLFYVQIGNQGNNKIQYVFVEKEFKPDFLNRKNIKIDLNNNNPWHIGFISHNEFLYMLICCKENKIYNLYIARSINATDWMFSRKVLQKNTYRSTGFIKNDILYLYYSKQNVFGAWEIGITKININGFFS